MEYSSKAYLIGGIVIYALLLTILVVIGRPGNEVVGNSYVQPQVIPQQSSPYPPARL